MEPASFNKRLQGLFFILLLALALLPGCAQAQSISYASYGELEPPYSHQELAQMLAPVALYPDALLAQVLMASTYPVEVVEAERWVRRNPGLKDEALDAALLRRNWDPSVKALTHFPSILTLMSERLSETTELGNAFLAQEADVMTMVQELRAQAYAHGNLKTNDRQRVIVERQTIIIQPVNPRVVYVPYYDPIYVYGSWRYSAYPPYYWGPAGARINYGIGYWPGFYFNFTFGNWSYFDWHRRVIFVDVHTRPRFVYQEQWIVRTGTWKHAPVHRRSVAYRDHATASRFSQSTRTNGSSRQDRYSSSSPSRQELNRHSSRTTTRTQQHVGLRTTAERRTIQTQTDERQRTTERKSTVRNNRQQKTVTTQQQSVQPQRQQRIQRTSTENRQLRQVATEQRTHQPRGLEQTRQTRTTQPQRQQRMQRTNPENRQQRQEATEQQTQQPRGQEQREDNNIIMRANRSNQESRQTRDGSWRDQRSTTSNERDSRDNQSRNRR